MRNVRSLIVLFFFALTIRAAYDLHRHAMPTVEDSGAFDQIAWNLASEGRYEGAWNLLGESVYRGVDRVPTANRPPSYVFFLAAIYKIAGHHPVAAQLAQAVMGALLVLLVFALAKRISSNPLVPWMASGMAAVYPFFIYYDGILISESFITFWAMLDLWLYFLWTDSPRSWVRAGACGLGFAVLALAKTMFIPFFILLIACDVLAHWTDPERLQRWGRLAMMGFLFIVPLFLWAWRNQVVMGKFLLDTHSGKTSVECIMYYEQCKAGTFGQFFLTTELMKEARGKSEVELDAFYLAKTKQFIREHPLQVALQSLGNFKNFWRFYPRQDLAYPEGRLKITLISLITEPFLLIAGLIGMIQLRTRWRTFYPMWLMIIVLSGLHAITTGQMRYRLPLMPIFMMFSAAAIAPRKPA